MTWTTAKQAAIFAEMWTLIKTKENETRKTEKTVRELQSSVEREIKEVKKVGIGDDTERAHLKHLEGMLTMAKGYLAAAEKNVL